MPRYAPGAKLLYLGGKANTPLIVESKELARLRFPVEEYSQLPDSVLYWPKKRADIVYRIVLVVME